MSRGSYQAVIEAPADRLREVSRRLNIDPLLTRALLADIEAGAGADALPLLAFTLERLYVEYGGNGTLRLSDYEAMGRIGGSIEAAVERALSCGASKPLSELERDKRLALLRLGLIPWLASIDPDTGSPRRRVARMAEIPDAAKPLIHELVEQRLLITDISRDTGEVVVEPAHEALLRQWNVLQGWLSEDFVALTTLEGVKRGARDWAANSKEGSWLTHGEARLQQAERLRMRDDLAAHIEPIEQEYLDACRHQENEERFTEQARLLRERRNLRVVRWALLAFFGNRDGRIRWCALAGLRNV